MKNFTKGAIGLVAGGALIFGLAGCSGSTNNGTSTNSPAKPASTSQAATPTKPTPLASIPSLSGKDTQVAVDAGFLKALTTLKLTPGVSGKATLSTAGVLDFPITGGNVDYYDPASGYRPYVQGEIDHNGSGFTLTAGSTKVDLSNFKINPGTSKLYGTVSVNGKVAVDNAYLFTLDGTTLKPLQSNSDGTAVLEGTRVLVSPDAAALLDKTFNTTAVKGGLLVGIAKITVNTK